MPSFVMLLLSTYGSTVTVQVSVTQVPSVELVHRGRAVAGPTGGADVGVTAFSQFDDRRGAARHRRVDAERELVGGVLWKPSVRLVSVAAVGVALTATSLIARRCS